MSCHLAPTFAMTAKADGTIATHDSNGSQTNGLSAECQSGYIIASS